MELEGYAAAWPDVSLDHEGRRHRIAPYAFENPSVRGAEFGLVRLCYGHDRATWVACTRDGNLQLWQDAFGVAFSAALDGPGGFAIADDVARGTFQHMSIDWTPIEQRVEDGVVITERARLREISLTTNPACRQGAIWLSSWPPGDMPPRLQQQHRSWLASHPDNRRPAPAPAASRPRSGPVSARPSLGVRAARGRLRPMQVPGIAATVYAVGGRGSRYLGRWLGTAGGATTTSAARPPSSPRPSGANPGLRRQAGFT